MKYPTTEQVVEELTIREALLPPELRELRQKLSQKAKPQKRFCFYSLYAHVWRRDTRCKPPGKPCGATRVRREWTE
jgi:hypothetical protein